MSILVWQERCFIELTLIAGVAYTFVGPKTKVIQEQLMIVNFDPSPVQNKYPYKKD